MRAVGLLLCLAALASILRIAAPALTALAVIGLAWVVCFRLREVLLFMGAVCLSFLLFSHPAWFCALLVALVADSAARRITGHASMIRHQKTQKKLDTNPKCPAKGSGRQ